MARVTLPDDLVLQFEDEAKTTKQSLDRVLSRHLSARLGIPLTERVLTVRAEDRDALEQLLDGTFTESADLVRAVRRAVSVRIGGIDLALSHAQISAIIRRAEKNDLTFEQELSRSLTQLGDALLMGVQS